MEGRALAIANNDIVYLWWTYPEKIDGCLGFSVRRRRAGKPTQALPAFVGFDVPVPGSRRPRDKTTDDWPIQSYQWKDLFVPEERQVSYEIVPMTGTPGQPLTPRTDLTITTGPIAARDRVGDHRVVFNRGIISTQSLTEKLEGDLAPDSLRAHITDRKDPIRKALAGEATKALTSLLTRARKEGGTCFCALYELTDPELVDAIVAAKGHVEVILSNANRSVVDSVTGKAKSVYDGTNVDTRARLRAELGDALHDRLLRGNAIGHNKFIVYVDPGGQARSVMTGSTNWTPTGLCAQSNNVVIFESDPLAALFLDYWNRLRDDVKQAPDLRTFGATLPAEIGLGPGQGAISMRFSPNTVRKTKPKTNPPAPPDMAEVFAAIEAAKLGVLFLVFSAGAPSILQQLREVETARALRGEPFFVRGAISDAKTAREFADTRVFNDSARKRGNRIVTGIGGVRDPFAFWQAELAKLGHAVIHDKVLVVDPFTPDSIVVTGSHNLGFKASYSNDENLCVIRGNAGIAHAFTAHVLDIVNHYNWRFKLQREGPDRAFKDLEDDDRWQDKYFRGDGFLASRDLFFFPS